jgi:uncharacterized DUF497 family protein
LKNWSGGFEWNEDKAEKNLHKHRVSFYEATTVFDDFFAVSANDKEHSIYEQRFYMIGYSNNNRILTVSYTERNKIIRIISARLASKFEKKLYEN